MEQHQLRRRRRTAVTLSVALAALGLAIVAPVSAVEDVESVRIAGKDRFETAAKIASAAFPTGSNTVLVASGRAYPDALAGAALGLPLLLTERDELPAATTVALDDLDPDTVMILGGTAAVSQNVEDGIESLGYAVTRIAGADRYETAADIAESIGADNVNALDGMPTAIIATGLGFADALAGGPIATGDSSNDAFPILLVSDEVPESTSAALDALGIEQVIILGGSAAVSPSVEADLKDQTGNDAVRLAGENRYSTAVDIAEFAIESLDFPAEEVLLASGLVFADALAGGPLGGVRQAPMLLTDPAQLSSETEAFLVDHADTIETVIALGGTAAVSQGALDAAEAAAETPPETRTNETLDVTPQTTANQENGTTRTYVVTNVTSPIDIALLPCAKVVTAANGDTQFVDADSSGIADGSVGSTGTTNETDQANFEGYISSVNGDPQANDSDNSIVNDDHADDAAPEDGKVTFVVSGQSDLSNSSSCARPVAYYDDNANDGLDVTGTSPAIANEDFGTGGEVRFSPGGASAGVFDVNVDANDDGIDKFDGCTIESQGGGLAEIINEAECASFTYDANDTYQIDGKASTMAAFETLLTPDDDVRGTYAPNPADRSTFNLYQNDAPAPPTPSNNDDTQDASNPAEDGTGVELKYIESTTGTTDAYRLYRYVLTTTDAGVCPAFTTGKYTHLPDSRVLDPTPGGRPSNNSVFTMRDAAPQGVLCYIANSEEDFGEGPPSTTPVKVTNSAAAPTTTTTLPGLPTTTAPSGPPTITQARGQSPDALLSAGDIHELKFSEEMAPGTATGSYTVTGAPTSQPVTINCADNTSATCVLSSGNTVLTATIKANPNLVSYPLTITSTSGMKDLQNNETNVAATGDDNTIERDTLDTTGPMIKSDGVAFGSTPVDCMPAPNTAGALAGFGQKCDVLELTFDELIASSVGNPNSVTLAELVAILGPDGNANPDPAYLPTTVVKLTVSGAKLTLTVVESLAHGVENGDFVPGSSNSFVKDTAGNNQRPNPSPDTLPSL